MENFMENEKRNFILPTTVVRIVDFVGVDKDNEVEFTSKDKKFALCKTYENKIILVKFLTNIKDLEINEAEMKEFFEKKAKKSVKDQNILKIKEELNKDEKYQDKIMSEVTEKVQKENPDLSGNKLMMKVFSETEEELKKIAKDILIKDKTIKENTVIRIPLSSNKSKTANIKNMEIPIYESYSMLMNKNKEPNDNGLYVFSTNKHSIPLIIEGNKKGKKIVRLNAEFSNKDILLSLLNHSMRTFEKTKSYLLTMQIPEKSEEEIKQLVLELNRCSKSSSLKDKYPEILNKIIKWIEKNENDKILTFRKARIYIPLNISEDNIMDDTLLSKLPQALINVSLRAIEEDKEILEEDIKELIKEKIQNSKIYGLYNILYTIPDKDSDTYGFLLNNISKHQIMLSFEDTLDIYFKILDKYKDKIKDKKDKEPKDKKPVNLEF